VRIGPIRHQSALRDGCPKVVDGRHSVLLCQSNYKWVMDKVERIRRNDQPTARLASKFGDSVFYFGYVANRAVTSTATDRGTASNERRYR
jgi:hypothetical protein